MEGEERDADDLREQGGGEQYLTPTKSFSKKRVTAGAAVVGAVHASPEASMGRRKCKKTSACGSHEDLDRQCREAEVRTGDSHSMDAPISVPLSGSTLCHQVSVVT